MPIQKSGLYISHSEAFPSRRIQLRTGGRALGVARCREMTCHPCVQSRFVEFIRRQLHQLLPGQITLHRRSSAGVSCQNRIGQKMPGAAIRMECTIVVHPDKEIPLTRSPHLRKEQAGEVGRSVELLKSRL